MLNINRIKDLLNNHSVSYSNVIFWLENPKFIIDMVNKENGTLKKIWRDAVVKDGIVIFKEGWAFKNYPDNKEYSIEELMEDRMGIKNVPHFKKYFDRYVRTWYSFFMKGYRKEGEEIEEEDSKIFDWYPIDINTFLWISGLSNKEFNIDMLVEDCVMGKEIILENYKTKKEEVNTDIMKEIVSLFPVKVDEYKKGKTNLINMFLGEYLKRLKDKNVDKAMLLTGIKNFIEQC